MSVRVHVRLKDGSKQVYEAGNDETTTDQAFALVRAELGETVRVMWGAVPALPPGMDPAATSGGKDYAKGVGPDGSF